MHLANITDSIQVLADTTQAVDLFAAWVDYDRTTAKQEDAGHNKVALASVTASPLVLPPPSRCYREIIFLSCRAKTSNTLPTFVRPQLYDGTTAYDIFSGTLNPGDSMHFHKSRGWHLTPSSGLTASTADLITAFINELRLQSNSLGQDPILT